MEKGEVGLALMPISLPDDPWLRNPGVRRAIDKQINKLAVETMGGSQEIPAGIDRRSASEAPISREVSGSGLQVAE
jgi:hypothetical protein